MKLMTGRKSGTAPAPFTPRTRETGTVRRPRESTDVVTRWSTRKRTGAGPTAFPSNAVFVRRPGKCLPPRPTLTAALTWIRARSRGRTSKFSSRRPCPRARLTNRVTATWGDGVVTNYGDTGPTLNLRRAHVRQRRPSR